MAEQIRRRYDLPLDVPSFLAVLRSTEAVEERTAAGGAMAGRLVQHEVGDASVRIVVRSDIPLDWLPAAVRSRFSAAPSVERTEEWAATADGAASPLTFEFSGLPVTCDGEARLTPADAGSRLDLDLTMRVEVPLFGRTVERAAAPQIVSALDAEAAFYRSRDGSVRP